MDNIKLKKCSQCGVEKKYTSEHFHYKDKKRGKLRNNCKDCRNKEVQKKYGETKHAYTCKNCGKEYKAKAINRNSFCSRKCYFELKKINKARMDLINSIKKIKIKECVYCSKKFKSTTQLVYCSDKCRDNNSKTQSKQYYLSNKDKLIQKRKSNFVSVEKECVECGNVFETKYGTKRKKFCSDKCAKRYKNRKASINRRVQIRENGSIDYNLSLTKLIKKDKGNCKICGCKVDVKDYVKTKEGHFIAGINYPSIDHILPVSKGGTHTWSNVQLAHRGCNSMKSDNVIFENKDGHIVFSL